MKAVIFAVYLCLASALLIAENFPVPKGDFYPLSYTACTPVDEIVIDGNLNEVSWDKALWSEDFCDIEGSPKAAPKLRTRMKMLWDKDALYVAAELSEPHIWATLTQRDAVIFHDNDFEVFIDPDGDTHDYYELEINALGTLWDLFLINPYRDRQQVAVNAWDIRDISSAIGINGTLNDPRDTDIAWYVELKIPMQVLAECAHKPVPPVSGDFWRVNFSRVHWDTELVNGAYQKIAGKPEYNWVWSPQGLIAMHYPERWGYLFFDLTPVDKAEDLFLLPKSEFAKEYLRQLYYKQKQYHMDHGKFAKSLKQLQAKALSWDGKALKARFQTTSHGYIINLPAANELPALFIREDGFLWQE